MSLFDEEVYRVPPLKTALAERIGDAILAQVAPHHLTGASALDVWPLIDTVLPGFGIHVYPAPLHEMGDNAGCTDCDDSSIEIRLSEETWTQLQIGGRRAHMARGTFAHELAHAVVHMPYVRRFRNAPHRDVVFNRVARSNLRAFEDPEWQAWAVGSCVLAPRRAIDRLPGASVVELAETFQVSQALMAKHLRRLKMDRGQF